VLVVHCCRRKASTTIQCISHDRTPAERRHGGPDVELVLDAVVVQFCKGDARFDDGVSILGIYFDDFVHAVEIEGYRSGYARCWSAVSVRTSILTLPLRCMKGLELTHPKFFPLEKVHTGIPNSFEIFSTPRSSSTFFGRTAALGILRVPSASCNSYLKVGVRS
jgi:hypothetical protein